MQWFSALSLRPYYGIGSRMICFHRLIIKPFLSGIKCVTAGKKTWNHAGLWGWGTGVKPLIYCVITQYDTLSSLWNCNVPLVCRIYHVPFSVFCYTCTALYSCSVLLSCLSKVSLGCYIVISMPAYNTPFVDIVQQLTSWFMINFPIFWQSRPFYYFQPKERELNEWWGHFSIWQTGCLAMGVRVRLSPALYCLTH